MDPRSPGGLFGIGDFLDPIAPVFNFEVRERDCDRLFFLERDQPVLVFEQSGNLEQQRIICDLEEIHLFPQVRMVFFAENLFHPFLWWHAVIAGEGAGHRAKSAKGRNRRERDGS